MEFRCIACACAASFALGQLAFGQDFTNLDFASAVLPPSVNGPPSGGPIDFAVAFPGWTGYIGGNVVTQALYLETYLDTSAISLIAFPGVSSIPGDPAYPIAVLQAGVTSGPPASNAATVTLSQTGLVPPGTQSLFFYEHSVTYPSNDFAVTLDGQTLSLVDLGTLAADSNFTLYGADIGSWAGQTATLAFTVFPEQPHEADNNLYLSDIQFSPSAVPEPSILGLLSVCVLGRCWPRRPPNTSQEPTPTAQSMDDLSYTRIIKPGEPLARRRGSALRR